MLKREDLPDLLFQTIVSLKGAATIVDACKLFWDQHEKELKQSGDLFYTWQYDIRWAATELRKTGRMKAAEISPRGIWEVIKGY